MLRILTQFTIFEINSQLPYPPHHRELVNLLLRQEWYLQRLYANLSKDLASVLRKYKVKGKKNMWYGNTEVKKELNVLMARYQRVYFKYISEQIKKGWELSNKHNDTFVNNYTNGIKIPKKEKQKYYQRNNEALNAFVNRSQNGYKLSDRVWNLTNQTQEQIDHFIKAGLTDGRSASKLSQDVRQFLKEPDKRFRRIRDKETGKLKLSKPAKNYHPGQGVYRSSYKNALRLARNEINIAYRTSDFERRKQLPFILGVNVKLSPAHPQYDICDELQGEYTKNFKFTGWHPNCLCYTTSKKMDKKDFVKYLKGEKQPIGHTERIPKRAEKFIKSNAKKIKGYKGKPYFIADNFKATKDGFELKNSITKNNKSKKDLYDNEKEQLKKDYETLNRSVIFKEELKYMPGDVRSAYPKIDIEKKNAIFMYTDMHYLEINRFNRGQLDRIDFYPEHGITKEFYKTMTKTINKTLDEIPDKYKGIVYRGTNIRKTELELYKKSFKNGTPYTEKSFMSTTYNEKESFDGKVRIKIKSKTGTIIEKISNAKREKEVLFKTNQQFKVTKYDEYEGGVVYIDLEEI